MKIFLLSLMAIFLITLNLEAREIEYRYLESDGVYKCRNSSGKEGFNKGNFKECGQVSGKRIDSPALHLAVKGLQSVGTEYVTPDFSGSSFVGCDFTKASMNLAELKSTLIKKSKFDQAQITRCNAKASMIIQASFVEANLAQSKWSGSSINQSKYDRAKLKASDFTSSLMTDVSFESADLRSVSFENSSLTDVSFKNADLRGADFSKVLLSSVTWKGAKYNSSTKLPFSDSKATQYGMVRQ